LSTFLAEGHPVSPNRASGASGEAGDEEVKKGMVVYQETKGDAF
jgi:hypothetical protein